MVQRCRFLGVLVCAMQLLLWMPLEGVAQDSSIDMNLPDCLEGVGGEGGAAVSPYDEIIRKFAEQVDEFVVDSQRRMARCFAVGWAAEVPSSTDVRECRFTSIAMRQDSLWLMFESGTPIGGDESGWIDNTKTWISMVDPITGSPFPITGVGFGFEVHTEGSTEQSSDTLARESSVVVYYEPLRFKAVCSTDKF